MKRDKVIDEILIKIQSDVKKDFDGLDLSLEELESIINSQFEAVVGLMETEATIKLNYLGKFHIKPGRKETLDRAREFAKTGLTEERIKEIATEQGTRALYLRKIIHNNGFQITRMSADDVKNFIKNRQ